MKRLHLLRHAHSVAGDPQNPDHVRALSDRGREECARLAKRWRDTAPDVDLVLCSTAVRAAQTYEALKDAVPALPEPTYQPKLYLATPEEILKLLKATSSAAAGLLVIGHNPGLHELGLSLSRLGGELYEQLETGLPTAGLISFEIGRGGWGELAQTGARLIAFEKVA